MVLAFPPMAEEETAGVQASIRNRAANLDQDRLVGQ